MKKIIGIIPTVIKKNKTIHFILDNNLILFAKKCFPEYDYNILVDTQNRNKLNLIISTGGNSITYFKNNFANKYRKKIDEFYLKYAVQKNLPFLGICHGAQFLANFYNSKIRRIKNHVRTNHIIKLNSIRKIYVNSYHNFAVTKLGKKLKKLAWSKDGSIEAFKHLDKKILGIMWHPERYEKIRKFDLEFIQKNL